MTNPMETYDKIYKYLTNEPMHMEDGVIDIKFMIDKYSAKYCPEDIVDNLYSELRYEKYMDQCINSIVEQNKLNTIMIPLVFKDFIDICYKNKLFSPFMLKHLQDKIHNITYETWITCDTYIDIINDYISYGAKDIFDNLKDTFFFPTYLIVNF